MPPVNKFEKTKVHIVLKPCTTKVIYVLTKAINTTIVLLGDPGKESTCKARHLGSIPGLEESMATHSSILVEVSHYYCVTVDVPFYSC